MRRWAALTAFVMVCASFACSQTAPDAVSAAQPSAAKLAKIRELVRLTGGPQIAVNMIKSQIASIKTLLPFPPRAQDDFEKEFLASVNVNEFIDLIVPIYDRHFSEDDVDGILAFYRGPIGQRLTQALPEITAESQEAGKEWGQGLGKKVGQKIAQKLAHGDYGPWPPERQDSPQEKH
ncbi:MAG: DUF2059 domain-containing protein [Terriglobales bacterium]